MTISFRAAFGTSLVLRLFSGNGLAGWMRAAAARGAKLRLGIVTGLRRRNGDVVGVDLDGEGLEGDAVAIAMGPWSVLAAHWLPLPPYVRADLSSLDPARVDPGMSLSDAGALAKAACDITSFGWADRDGARRQYVPLSPLSGIAHGSTDRI